MRSGGDGVEAKRAEFAVVALTQLVIPGLVPGDDAPRGGAKAP